MDSEQINKILAKVSGGEYISFELIYGPYIAVYVGL